MMLIYLICLLSCVSLDAKAMDCGRTATPPSFRIVGGYETNKLAWPWVVSLNFGTLQNGTGTRGGHICGGTLLHSQWVLTAAHCLDTPGNPNTFPKSPPKDWRVTAGMHTRSYNESLKGHWQSSAVKRFIYHKEFHDYTVYSVHDIALVQLTTPFKYTNWVRPICLPNRRTVQPGWNRCYTAGWGTKNENSTYYSLTLQEVPIPVVNKWFCYARYPGQYKANQHICGGDWFDGNKDACKGDSGGPLACRLDSGSWYVAGIVSWGIGCGRKHTPGVYTNVQAYESWIIQVVRKFTVVPKRLHPKAYISQQNKKRRRRSIRGVFVDHANDVISSPVHMTSSERTAFRKNYLSRHKRETKRSSTEEMNPSLSWLTPLFNSNQYNRYKS